MRRIGCGLLAALCLLLPLCGCGSAPADGGAAEKERDAGFSLWEPEEAPAEGELAAALENDRYTLLAEPETGEFAVTDRQTGQTLYADPRRGEELDTEEETVGGLLSPLVLHYSDRLQKQASYNVFDDCLAYDGQVQVMTDGKTLRILYTLGKDNEKMLLPQTLTVEAYEAYTGALSGAEKRAVTQNYRLLTTAEMTNGVADPYLDKAALLKDYPALRERDLYVLRDISDAKKKRVSAALVAAGLTYDDVLEQRELSGMTYTDDSVKFEVPLDITLTEEGFTAAVDPTGIRASEGCTVLTLELLPGLGATAKAGRFFVPDGTGAEIPFQTAATAAYSQRVYGEDGSRIRASSAQGETPVILPCYAMTGENGTLFADITSGAAAAAVWAVPAGGLNRFARAGFTFTVTDSDSREENADAGSVEAFLPAKRSETARLAVRYRFSAREETYAELAVAYRAQLTADGVLTRRETGTAGFVLDLYGMMQKEDNILGVPVTKNVPLTTFAQAEEILAALRADGVDGIRVRYLGMGNGGLQNRLADALRPEPCLGGARGFAALCDYAAAAGATLYPDLPIGTVSRDGWFDGFRKSRDVCRLCSGQLAVRSATDPVDGGKTGLNPRYTVSAASLRGLTARLTDSLRGNTAAVSFSTAGRVLDSDFDRRRFSSRVGAADAVSALLAAVSDAGVRVMADTGHLYALRDTDTVVGLPAGSSGFAAESRCVPFAQIVLSGSVDYAMRAFNGTGSEKQERLRAVETGALPYYRLMYADNIVLKNSAYEALGSVSFAVWRQSAAEAYAEVSAALSAVRGAQITDHRYLTGQVTCTAYDNGVSVYVNYGETVYTADGLTVPAGGYAVKGGAS